MYIFLYISLSFPLTLTTRRIVISITATSYNNGKLKRDKNNSGKLERVLEKRINNVGPRGTTTKYDYQRRRIFAIRGWTRRGMGTNIFNEINASFRRFSARTAEIFLFLNSFFFLTAFALVATYRL